MSQFFWIKDIVWHPLYTGISTDPSPMRDFIAVASLHKNAYVIDLSEVLNDQAERPTTPVVTSVKTLAGHESTIFALCWSPYEDGRILTVARDNTAMVKSFDIISSKNSIKTCFLFAGLGCNIRCCFVCFSTSSQTINILFVAPFKFWPGDYWIRRWVNLLLECFFPSPFREQRSPLGEKAEEGIFFELLKGIDMF